MKTRTGVELARETLHHAKSSQKTRGRVGALFSRDCARPEGIDGMDGAMRHAATLVAASAAATHTFVTRNAGTAPNATGASTNAKIGTLRTAKNSTGTKTAAKSRSRDGSSLPKVTSIKSSGNAPNENAKLLMLVGAHSAIEPRIGLIESSTA